MEKNGLGHPVGQWFAYHSNFPRILFAVKIQGDQDHFFTKEMLISPSILKLHKNPWIWEGLTTIHFI